MRRKTWILGKNAMPVQDKRTFKGGESASLITPSYMSYVAILNRIAQPVIFIIYAYCPSPLTRQACQEPAYAPPDAIRESCVPDSTTRPDSIT